VICAGGLVILLAAGLFLWHIGTIIFRGYVPLHIPAEVLENPPIALESGIADRIVHRVDAHSLFKNRPFGASNAAVSYLDVVRSMESRRDTRPGETAAFHQPRLTDEEFQKFMHGVEQAECDFSQETLVLDGKSVRLAPAVDIADNLAHLRPFRTLAMAVVARGEEYESVGNLDMAVTCYEGVVKFGLDVEKGRESLLQVFIGTAIQRSGARKLQELYQETGAVEEAQRWQAFLRDLDVLTERFKNKMTKLTKTPGIGAAAIADKLWILEHDEDPLFRREALVGLGAMRALAPDVIGPALEHTAASDPDPYVREAAQNALGMGIPSAPVD
jgi:hypothetical protein